MEKFAIIDTETNWADSVMFIGTVITDADSFQPIEAKYPILPIKCEIGGMYYDTLFIETPVKPILCNRAEADIVHRRATDLHSTVYRIVQHASLPPRYR